LRGVSLNVDEGTITCITGPNGAGKTTLFKTIMGLHIPYHGSIVFYDEDITVKPPRYRVMKGIAMSPDYRGIYANLTVKDNILLPLMALGVPRSVREERLAEILKVFPELSTLLDRSGTQTSGGQQKMIAIARALILKPKLLLLDEPFEGLALPVQRRLQNILREIRDTMRCTLLIAEPTISPLKGLCDHVFKIDRGVVYRG
jgi:ABC-type branched-subunit amino acid transport system ATPase component